MDSFTIDMGITPLLYKVAHKCNHTCNEKLKQLSVSIQQGAILMIIELIDEGKLNQKNLSNELGVKESSISSIIKTMIKNDLIYKEQSKTDGRNQLLKITRKGKQICDAMKESARDVEQELYGSLTEEERESFIAILKKLL